jgi:hypothetical protein
MKLTKRQLKRLIKEELNREQFEPRQLHEQRGVKELAAVQLLQQFLERRDPDTRPTREDFKRASELACQYLKERFGQF